MASLDDQTAEKILHQVEFYFSDSNLPRDDFLRRTVSRSKNGLVSLALICSFSRMRAHLRLGNAKCEDISDEVLKSVAEILRKSKFLKVSDDGKKVGRANKLLKPEEAIEQVDIRTIAASPFEHDVKIEDVQSFFAGFGKVNSIRLPRHVADKRLFCGTALVEFSTDREAEEVMKRSLTYCGANLEMRPKKEFDHERTKTLKQIGKFETHTGSDHNSTCSASDYPRGLIVAFSLKRNSTGKPVKNKSNTDSTTNSQHGCKRQKLSDSKEHAIALNKDASEVLNKEPLKNNAETIRRKGKMGCKIAQDFENIDNITARVAEMKEEDIVAEVIKDKGGDDAIGKSRDKSPENVVQASDRKVGEGKESSSSVSQENDTISHEYLKEIFQRFGVVKHVDYAERSDSGYIHFEQPGAAIKARAAAEFTNGLFIVKDFVTLLDPVTGETEKEYWSKFPAGKEGAPDSRWKSKLRKGGRTNEGRKRSPKDKKFATQ